MYLTQLQKQPALWEKEHERPAFQHEEVTRITLIIPLRTPDLSWASDDHLSYPNAHVHVCTYDITLGGVSAGELSGVCRQYQ